MTFQLKNYLFLYNCTIIVHSLAIPYNIQNFDKTTSKYKVSYKTAN